MAGQILGAAVYNDVCPKGQWVLQIGREKGIIHDKQRPMCMCQLGSCADISNMHHRVGGCFDIKRLRFGADRCCHLRGAIAEVHRCKGNTTWLTDRVEQPWGAAVQVSLRHDMISRCKQLHHRQNRSHTGGKRNGIGALFQCRHRLFQLLAGGVLHTAVIIAGAFPKSGVGKGRCLVNRKADSAVPRCGVVPLQMDTSALDR